VTGYPCEDLTKGYSLHSVKKKLTDSRTVL